MIHRETPTQPIILSLSDCWAGIKSSWKTLLWMGCVSGLLFFGYRLTQQPSFTAEGMIRTSSNGKSSSQLTKALESFTELKQERFTDSIDPKLFLLTEPVLTEAVEALSLQGHIHLKKKQGLLARIWNNLHCAYAYHWYLHTKRPASEILHKSILIPDRLVFSDPPRPLWFENASYHLDFFSTQSLFFVSPDLFELRDHKGHRLAKGKLGEKVTWEQGEFVLHGTPGKFPLRRRIAITWIPVKHAAASLQKSLTVTHHKKNKDLISIVYTHSDRLLAAAVVNAVIDGYQNYLKKESERKILHQLDYLRFRQLQTREEWESLLNKHHDALLQGLKEGNFIVLEGEADFMAKAQADCQSRLFQITSDLFRLQEKEDISSLIASFDPKTISSLPLNDAKELLSQSLMDLEKIDLEKRKIEECLYQLEVNEGSIVSFSHCFDDPFLQSLFTTLHTLSLQLIDENHWTPKEKERIQKDLETQKASLQFQLHHLFKGNLLKEETLRAQIDALKQSCISSLVDEYKVLQEKMHALAEKSSLLLSKWSREKKIDLEAKLYQEVIETLAKIIEAKNITYYTEIQEVSPFIKATAPSLPRAPRLFLHFFCGVFVGVSLFLLGGMIRLAWRGPSASPDNLRSFSLKHLGSLSSSSLPSLSKMAAPDLGVIKALALELCQQKKEAGEIILCLSKEDIVYLDSLAELLAVRKEKILLISLNSSLEPSLFSSHQPPILHEESYDILPAGITTASRELLLTSSFFKETLASLQETYQWIFLTHSGTIAPETFKTLKHFSHRVIYQLTEETLSSLTHYPQETLFLSLHKSPHPKALPLSDIKSDLEAFLNTAFQDYSAKIKPIFSSFFQKNKN